MAEARGRAEHKELLIKGILDSYADAYRNCLKFPVEPELYREDWDFINRLNEKMADAISNDTHEIMTVYGSSNGLTDLFSGSGAHHGHGGLNDQLAKLEHTVFNSRRNTQIQKTKRF